ncbi:MAG: hypothetical protein A2Y07_09055 [Planctomycetes bacterium GWF2_50_10]|nr:MAG: hypothetical protein A2Y07_09055 [Planctomycetes bacterium GWF2_50_10]
MWKYKSANQMQFFRYSGGQKFAHPTNTPLTPPKNSIWRGLIRLVEPSILPVFKKAVYVLGRDI